VAKNFWTTLWNDQAGSVAPATYVLLVTILCIGLIPGLSSFRNALVQEMGDLAVSLETLDQSYSFTLGTTTSQYTDPTTTLTDPAGGAPAGISVSESPTGEGGAGGGGGGLPASPGG
jgi:hypothetical protein